MGFDPMEAKKLGDESILICFYMVVVALQHIQQHLPSNGNSPRNAKIRHSNGPGILPFRSLMLPILFSVTGGDLEKEKGWAC
jgi:hypothetical protein